MNCKMGSTKCTFLSICFLIVGLSFLLPTCSNAQPEGIPCDPEPTDMPVDYGDLITCSIDPVGDVDIYRFFGNIGEFIAAIVSAQSGFLQPCIELIAPGGSRLTACDFSNTNRIDTTLEETGIYTILVSDRSNDQTGGYGLTLLCLLGPCEEPAVTCNGRKPTILGTDDDNVIIGTVGDDVIHGLDGHDVIDGLGGRDIICGGAGNDSISGGAGWDLLIGGPGHDVLEGNAGNDKLYGNEGNDTLVGGTGDDELYGSDLWEEDNDSCYDQELNTVAEGVFEGCEAIYLEGPFDPAPSTN